MGSGRVYAAILAGGSGTRMGNPDKPKQFWLMGGKPVIVHTVEKFCLSDSFDKVIVLAPKGWMQQTQDIIDRDLPQFHDRIALVAGGAERNDTIMNAIAYIENEYGLGDDDIIVTHDAVRPFVSHRIIEENIEAARAYGAVDTVIPATDTIVQSIDGKTIEEVKKAYETILATQEEKDRSEENIGNAPVISVEDHTGLPNNASYTIGVANETGITGDVYGDKSNTVTVKPDKPDKPDDDDKDSEKDKKDDETKPDNNKPDNKKPLTPSKKKAAKTGDDFNAGLWFALLGAAAAGAVLALRKRRRGAK